MFLLVLEACKISVDKQPTQTADISVAVSTKQEMIVSPSLTAIPSKTVTLSPSVTPTQTPSATLLPSSTPTLSPTLEPSDTPTLSPTPSPTVTPAGFQRGIYAAAGCIQVTLTKYMWVDWCVINVEINRDQSMVFNVTWKAYTPHRKIIKRSDKNNPDMYLTDNLGNHYSFIGLSGGAGEDVLLLHDETYRGAFIFPPALPGADTFSFHDSDNGLTIDNLHLDKPYIAIYDFVFQYNGLALEYPDNKWIVKKDENGKPFLNYILLENCHFREAET